MTHDVDWYSPAPLWSGRLQNGTGDRLREPALVRFAKDDFMGELQRVLETAPGGLTGKLAEESSDEGVKGTEDDPLSFYQPAHQRYYMVTASLVCRERGLPDRAVDTTTDERTAFVLRRLVAPDAESTETHEYGWTGTAWKPVDDPTEVADAEQPLKMFPKSYAPKAPAEQMKGDRRVWAGLIPAGKRDTYETAPVRHDKTIGTASAGTDGSDGAGGDEADNGEGASELPPKGDDLSDPRKTKFATQVIGAFDGVRDALKKENSTVTAADVRDPLVFAWLDLWQFLGEHFDGIQETIADDKPIGSDDSDVLRVLDAIDVSRLNGWTTAADALRAVEAHESEVEGGTLSDVLKPSDLPSLDDGTLDRVALRGIINKILAAQVGGIGESIDTPALQEVVDEELGTLEDPSTLTGDLKPPATDPAGAGQYVVRCLYERPNCPPRSRVLVSRPSKAFQLASFFDADAPARDINITLPSSAMEDLRDSSQSVNLVFAKELRRQAERVQKVTLDELQKGEVGEAPAVNIGMICSLSIPIITICALVLLIIMVSLLNIVFWWLPFFKICFPLPSSD